MNKSAILKIIAINISLLIFYILPNIGLYVICLTSTIVLYFTFVNLKLFLRLLIAFTLSGIIFISLIDRAYENQGWKVISLLFDYHHTNNQTVPKNLEDNIVWKLNSYTPLFEKYRYNYSEIRLEYKDIWGEYYHYDDKEGEFRIGTRFTLPYQN